MKPLEDGQADFRYSDIPVGVLQELGKLDVVTFGERYAVILRIAESEFTSSPSREEYERFLMRIARDGEATWEQKAP